MDSFSFYRSVTRNILIKKNIDILNCYDITSISKILYSFSLYKIEDLDEVQIYNYIYFFKFFFGRRGFLTKYKSFFNLGL